MSGPLLPGSTIGILGGGQLGRMLAMAARRMDYRTLVFDPAPGCPASQVADGHLEGAFDDPEAIAAFCRGADVATVEFENIPVETLRAVGQSVPVRPGAEIVHVCQNREREKNWLRDHGIPCPAFTTADSARSVEAAVAEIGAPCVVKTAAFGYDGKGQQLIRRPEEVDWNATWDALAAPRAIVESWIDFRCELSVICARGLDGGIVTYDPALNVHRDHILDTSTVPAPESADLLDQARRLAAGILEAFGYVGVLGVELFVTADDRLLVNELAPRTHNSGHHTIDACVTSQFEQQLRAICGLPLGRTDLLCPVVMRNLLGDFWLDAPGATPDWARLLAENPGSRLHLYGKRDPRRRRKMGHLTTLSTS